MEQNNLLEVVAATQVFICLYFYIILQQYNSSSKKTVFFFGNVDVLVQIIARLHLCDADDLFLWSMVVVGEAFLIEYFGVQFDSDCGRHGDGCGGKTTEQKVDNLHSQV